MQHDHLSVDPCETSIVGFMHIALLPGWKEIVSEQLWKLHVSGLYDATKCIFVGLVGPDGSDFDFSEEKLRIAFHDQDMSRGELPTLEFLHGYCSNQPATVFYIHTKGVSRNTEPTRDWRRLMEHFVIFRHTECLQALKEQDICGVNWQVSPLPHFSGNFWWARGAYVRSLTSPSSFAKACAENALVGPPISPRWSSEFWIASGPTVRAANLHASGVNHYHEQYSWQKYAPSREVVLTDSFPQSTAWVGLENCFQVLLEPIGSIRRVIDIGVGTGFSLFSFASALPDATVIGVDPYEAQSVQEFRRISRIWPKGMIGSNEAERWVRRQLHRFPNVELRATTSLLAAREETEGIDVLHIDAVHTFDDVQQDFSAWEPLVRPGGCVLFHGTQAFPEDIGLFFCRLPSAKTEIQVGQGLGAWYKPHK